MLKRASLVIQVINALILRELKTRFGQFRMGYLWAVGEPVAHVVILSAIFGFRSPTTPEGIDFPVFIATGIIPYLFFTRMVTRGMSAVEGNRQLFSYPQVRPFDALAARAALEAVIQSAVFLLVIGLGAWLGYDVACQNPLTVLLLFLSIGMFGLGVGALACVANTFVSDTGQVIGIVTRVLYFTSGIFFSMERIPTEYHPWLLWNPVLHGMELLRESYFRQIDTSYGDPAYLAWWMMASLALGLLTFHVYRDRMVAS